MRYYAVVFLCVAVASATHALHGPVEAMGIYWALFVVGMVLAAVFAARGRDCP